MVRRMIMYRSIDASVPRGTPNAGRPVLERRFHPPTLQTTACHYVLRRSNAEQCKVNYSLAGLEKAILLKSAIGAYFSLYAALVGNFVTAASTLGITFVLLGLMLDYAIAEHNAQAHWLTARHRSSRVADPRASTHQDRG